MLQMKISNTGSESIQQVIPVLPYFLLFRYRKLSTRIHPDKLRNVEEPRLAFEEVNLTYSDFDTVTYCTNIPSSSQLKTAYHKLMDEKQRNVILLNIEFVEGEVKKERKRLLGKGVSSVMCDHTCFARWWYAHSLTHSGS